jgi:MoaA/NifB/PqqE/SkfB family radical SAM enzyme
MMLRLAAAFFKIFVLKQKPLRYVDFNITDKCNLRCEHCFAVNFKKIDRPCMKIEDYRRVMKEANRLGAVNFSFQGGEPLLFPRLEELIVASAPYKNIISVTTNGTLLTPERAKKLKKIGVDIFTISLDSLDAGEHDCFRNKEGAFAKTLQGIQAALDSGTHVTIGTVISHKNIREKNLERLFEWACKKKMILCVALAVPAGNWNERGDILLTDDDMSYFFQLKRKYPYVRMDFEANYVKWGCGAIKEILYLTPFGDVLPCPYIHISFGNIFEQSLAEVRSVGLDNSYFKGYWQKCLCATDTEFINRYILNSNEKKEFPVNHTDVFISDEENADSKS